MYLSLKYIANAKAIPSKIYFIFYLIFIFSGINPFGRYLIMTNSPIPIIKNLKYGALSIKCTFKVLSKSKYHKVKFIGKFSKKTYIKSLKFGSMTK